MDCSDSFAGLCILNHKHTMRVKMSISPIFVVLAFGSVGSWSTLCKADPSGSSSSLLTEWQTLFAQVFDPVKSARASNTTASQVNEKLLELRRILNDDEAAKSIPEEQRREVKSWLMAAHLQAHKCRASYEEQILSRGERYAGSNLIVFVDDIRRRLAHHCLHETGLYHQIEPILKRFNETVMSFVDESGRPHLVDGCGGNLDNDDDDDVDGEVIVDDRKVADYLAPSFDPLWPGQAPESDSATFKQIYSREIGKICGEIVAPLEADPLAVKFVIKSEFLPAIDPEDRVFEWNRMLKVCSYLQENAKSIYHEFADAVTRYQYYEAPIRDRSQLVPEKGTNEQSWAYLYAQVFKAAPEDIIKPMTVEQVVATMKRLGSLMSRPDCRAPKKQQKIVKLWLNQLLKPSPINCNPDHDEWLRYHMSEGLPGVGFVPCNLKLYVEHVRSNQFNVCVNSPKYEHLRRDVERIPAEDIELLKSIKPIGLYGGGFSVEQAADHLAKYYKVNKAPYILEHGKNMVKFNKVYDEEISQRCDDVVGVYFNHGDLIDYLMNRYFADRIDGWLKQWSIAMASCDLLVSDEHSGRELLYSELRHALKKVKGRPNFLG